MLKVYLKELLELTRDRKTMMFTILLPTLVMPVILLGFGGLTIYFNQKAEKEILVYHLVGEENYPELTSALAENESFVRKKLDKDADFESAIESDQVRFVVTIPVDTMAQMQKGHRVEIEVLYNDSSSTSAKVISRLNKTFDELKKKEVEGRIQSFGLSTEQRDGLLEPIKLVGKTTADRRESFGQQIGGLLPYILILLGLAGAMYPAIDLGVGEKERGTLETLLLTPVPRFHIVFAKFLVIFTTSFMSILLSLVSFALIVMILGPLLYATFVSDGGAGLTKLFETLNSIRVVDVLLIFLMLVPVAAIFGSVLLSVSIYARTFKEAQNYMSPITMFAFLPVLLGILPGVKLDWVWAMVPLTNVALAIKEIFKGTIDYSMLMVILGSTSIVAGALLYLCHWWFQREQVLFRN